MNCPKCGNSSFKGANFCGFCGSALKAARIKATANEKENISLKLLHLRRPLLTLLSLLLIVAVMVPALFAAGGCGGKREYSEEAIKWLDQGDAYNTSKNYNEAITAFSKAIEIEPRYKEAYKNRGNAYYYLKQYDKAMEDYNMALKIDPEFPNIYSNIGNILSDEGKYEEAIKMYDKAISLDPDCGHYYWRRGDAKERSSKEDYKRGCELGLPDACKKY